MNENFLEYGFVSVYSNECAMVYKQDNLGVLACELTVDYVSIKVFMETFNEIGRIAKTGQFSTFLFDKRALRTFHQPSMEWYFLVWKGEMLSYGLYKHRKLLPALTWFVKAAEIAREPLLSAMDKNILSKLDILYCNSLEEALNS